MAAPFAAPAGLPDNDHLHRVLRIVEPAEPLRQYALVHIAALPYPDAGSEFTAKGTTSSLRIAVGAARRP